MQKTFLICSLIIIFVTFTYADYFSDKLPAACKNVLPRVRNSWSSLTEAQQQTYVKTVVKMKAYKEQIKKGSTSKFAVYNTFVMIHAESYNSYGWHGTSLFLPAHKWYLWVYESALILTAYNNYAAVGLASASDACKLSIPYWDWIDDFDANNQCDFVSSTNSGLLDSKDIGSNTVAANTYYVQDGAFSTTTAWTLTYAITDNYYTSIKADKRLKRSFDCYNYPLSYGPQQMMDAITGYPVFGDFTSFLEGGPHGLPHMLIGFSMSTMASPDDALFFLHHAQVDRLYHLWADCHEYEFIAAKDITNDQYTPLNPNPWFGGPATTNPYTGKVIKVGKTDQMPYAYSWDSSRKAVVETTIFPTPWPTPQDMWPSINGYGGFNLRYGPDKLVNSLGSACTSNVKWTLVNYTGGKKRATSDEEHPKWKEMSDRFQEGINSGKSHSEVIRSMAMEECEQTPKLKVTQQLKDWLRMNNLGLKSFDRVCDKVSERSETDQLQVKTDDTTSVDFTGTKVVPLWVIVTASIGTLLLLIAIITLIVLYFRRKNSVSDKDYAEMK